MIADGGPVCRGSFAVVFLTPSRASPLPQVTAFFHGNAVTCGRGLAREDYLSDAESLNGCMQPPTQHQQFFPLLTPLTDTQ